VRGHSRPAKELIDLLVQGASLDTKFVLEYLLQNPPANSSASLRTYRQHSARLKKVVPILRRNLFRHIARAHLPRMQNLLIIDLGQFSGDLFVEVGLVVPAPPQQDYQMGALRTETMGDVESLSTRILW
jgi:hypothetical protein